MIRLHPRNVLALLGTFFLLMGVSTSSTSSPLSAQSADEQSALQPQIFVPFFSSTNESTGASTTDAPTLQEDLVNAAALGGSTGTGQWSSIIDLPLVPVAAANLPNGKVLMWSAYDRYNFGGDRGETYTSIFDPTNNSASLALISNTNHDMFCPGTTNLADGRVLVNGGSSSAKTSIYNSVSDSWTSAADMSIPRGYHANTILPNGSVFTIGGSWSGGQGNKHSEVWTAGSGWARLAGIPVDPIIDGITDPQGIYREDNHAWLWTAPNGKVFHAGPSTYMHWLDTASNGSHVRAGTRGNDDSAMTGTSVMYDIGKILKVGGSTTYASGSAASPTSYTIDINSATPSVNQTGNLNRSRAMHNSVVLPDGQVLVIGGIATARVFADDNTRLVAELWNPQTGQWRDVAAMQVSRTYHSTALLLPDGRVFAGGGGLCGSCSVNHPNAEIYSPPYLFSNNSPATRPVIQSAPGSANYGATINVRTDSAISAFSLIRLSSVTHSTNNDQRRIPLTPTQVGTNSYNMTIPNNRGIAPPGYYMLFALNSAGTPSVAKMIQLDGDVSPPTTDTYRYVRFVADSEVNGNPWTSMAEFNVFDDNGNTIGRNTWTIDADSEEVSGEDGRATNAIDGDPNTFWHTEWLNADPVHPHQVTVDMGSAHAVGGFRYLPRPGGGNGTIADYRFFISNDGANWGAPVAQGTFANNADEKIVTIDSTSPPQPTPTPTPAPTPTPTPTPVASQGTINVNDMQGSSTSGRRSRWNANVTTTVVNQAGNPVSGVTVKGNWSNGVNGSGSCVTQSNGRCTISKGNLKSRVSSVRFTISTLELSGFTYQPSLNTVSSIIISSP